MKVAIPSEVKNNEFRVAITPAGVHDLPGPAFQKLAETVEDLCDPRDVGSVKPKSENVHGAASA